VLVAVSEEIFFRGLLLGSIEWRVRTVTACLIVGITFGIMHLTPGKILPTAIAGMWFTYVSLRTRSVFTGIVAHFLLNSAAFLFIMNFPLFRGWIAHGAPPESVWWFAGSAVLLGIVIVACEALQRRGARVTALASAPDEFRPAPR
jgi:uncharacterized YccA/Bax inhibitor family protein